jgi:aminoglycoside phosphotransferase (APT) family kinase protein
MLCSVNEWDADVVVDEALAHQLVATQFPQLMPECAGLRVVGGGWDNTLWQIERPQHAGPPIVARIPRRTIAIAGVRREIDYLPRIAPLVPLPIPLPLHVGRPQGTYPWPFFACELLDGSELAEARLDDHARATLAPQLGAFLRALHAPTMLDLLDPGAQLPIDCNRRADMHVRTTRGADALREALGAGVTADQRAACDELFERARPLRPDTDIVLVHGDLHLRHVLVDAHGNATGVIDWGDLCRAPRSVDLMIAYMAFAPPERALLFAAYGGEPAVDVQLRSRVLAVFLCARLAAYAQHEGMHALRDEALAGISRALA